MLVASKVEDLKARYVFHTIENRNLRLKLSIMEMEKRWKLWNENTIDISMLVKE
jgi:hypothetical protein